MIVRAGGCEEHCEMLSPVDDVSSYPLTHRHYGHMHRSVNKIHQESSDQSELTPWVMGAGGEAGEDMKVEEECWIDILEIQCVYL